MKHFIIFLTLLVHLTGANGATRTVTSAADSGEGSLRTLIETADPGDKILVPPAAVITLESEIAFSKTLHIDGQGATLRTRLPEAPVDSITHRIFNIGDYPVGSVYGDPFAVAIENIRFEGGNIAGLQGNGRKDANGASIHVEGHIDFAVRNCTFTGGRATTGGAIAAFNSDGLKVEIENCTFASNFAASGSGACYLKGDGGVTVRNSTFEQNESKGASAIILYNSTTVDRCLFRENRSTEYGRGCTTLAVHATATGTVIIENSAFVRNTALENRGGDGGAALVTQAHNASILFRNNTVYANRGSRGAVYNYQGNIDVVNCTFAANVSANTESTASDQKYSSYGGAFGNQVNYDDTGIATTARLVNNIFAYNYDHTGLSDMYLSTRSLREGVANLLVRCVGGASADFTLRPVIAYDPEVDLPLFTAYTRNENGKVIPLLDETTSTLPLAGGCKAISAGVTSVSGKPSGNMYGVSLTGLVIPAVDRLGTARPATPSLGAVQYVAGASSINRPTVGGTLLRTDVFDLAGRKILSLPGAAGNALNAAPSLQPGIYIVHRETATGVSREKQWIK